MSEQITMDLLFGLFFGGCCLSTVGSIYLLSRPKLPPFSKLNIAGIFAITLGAFAITLGSIMTLFSGIETNRLDAKNKKNTEAKEIAAFQEYEANKKIDGDKAWWINLPKEKLIAKCQSIAKKINRDWQSLVNLLSGENSTVIMKPQPESP